MCAKKEYLFYFLTIFHHYLLYNSMESSVNYVVILFEHVRQVVSYMDKMKKVIIKIYKIDIQNNSYCFRSYAAYGQIYNL